MARKSKKMTMGKVIKSLGNFGKGGKVKKMQKLFVPGRRTRPY